VGCGAESSSALEPSLVDGAAGGNGTGDDPPDAGPACERSLADLCGADRCRTTWPTDAGEFCGGAGVGPGGIPSVSDSCDGYRVLVVQGVDMNSHSYYRADTNELVSIVIFSANTMKATCYGPTDFEEPTCAGSPTRLECARAERP
jgi:hypothetical protein